MRILAGCGPDIFALAEINVGDLPPKVAWRCEEGLNAWMGQGPNSLCRGLTRRTSPHQASAGRAFARRPTFVGSLRVAAPSSQPAAIFYFRTRGAPRGTCQATTLGSCQMASERLFLSGDIATVVYSMSAHALYFSNYHNSSLFYTWYDAFPKFSTIVKILNKT